MWRAEGKWLPKTSRKAQGRTDPVSVLMELRGRRTLIKMPCEISAGTQCCEDDHGNSNSSHVKIFLPKKLLECLPKCSSLPKERHRWNTNERS
ncbi:calmodulin-binding transcription activator 1 isoform X17 [Symphalangus syndactylus]|nr:calmodulin-binding transcription activator 1 isoform X15 [Symphalangus syndactylus]